MRYRVAVYGCQIFNEAQPLLDCFVALTVVFERAAEIDKRGVEIWLQAYGFAKCFGGA